MLGIGGYCCLGEFFKCIPKNMPELGGVGRSHRKGLGVKNMG